MPMQERSYADVRSLVRPGDVVAFGGDNPLSMLIMRAGKSDVSHAGVVVAQATPLREVQFLEATIRVKGNAATSVAKTTDLPDRIDEYDGRVWWLPLSPPARLTFQAVSFADYVRSVQGKLFDIAEGAAVVIKDALQMPNPPVQVRTGDALFCSELVVEALHRGGVVGQINASATSPADLCRWTIYDATYVLLKGTAGSTIDGYNTLPSGTV